MRRVGLPRHLSEVPLGQICLRTELADPTKLPDDTFIYVDVSSVSNQSFSIEKTNELTGREAPSRARKVIHYDDIIFATVRPSLRRIALVPSWLDGQICSTGYCVVRPDTLRLLPSYAYFYLLSEEVAQRVEGMQKGATYPAISDADVLGLSIPLPPLPEQRTIAHILRAVQSAREARQREVSLERERKAALMAHLFTHGTRGEPTKQTPIGEMPESWEVTEVGRLGKVVTGSTPPTSHPEYYDGPYMFIGPGDMGDGKYVHRTQKYLSEKGLEVTRILPKGSVLVVCIGATIGKMALTTDTKCATNQQVNAVIPKDGINSDYLYYALDYHSPRLPSLAGRAAIPIVKKSSFASFMIPVPGIEQEQSTIGGALNACDAKIAALERESSLLDELFRALLEELMTGRLSVAEIEEGNG